MSVNLYFSWIYVLCRGGKTNGFLKLEIWFFGFLVFYGFLLFVVFLGLSLESSK